MSKAVFASTIVCGSLCVSVPASAQEYIEKSATHHLASKLVTNFWNQVKKQDVKAYSKLFARDFQGMNVAGAYTRKQQIAGLQALTVTSFKITRLIASQVKDTLVVSYNFKAKGRNIVSGPSMDIWQKIDRRWQQISHTYVPYQ